MRETALFDDPNDMQEKHAIYGQVKEKQDALDVQSILVDITSWKAIHSLRMFSLWKQVYWEWVQEPLRKHEITLKYTGEEDISLEKEMKDDSLYGQIVQNLFSF